MKLTARDMANLSVIDKIIQEPAGGAHTDWQTTMELLANAVADAITEFQKIPGEELPARRAEKFIAMTHDVDFCAPDHQSEEH